MMTAGCSTVAIAIITRWHMPPGELERIRVRHLLRLRQPLRPKRVDGHRRARPSSRPRGAPATISSTCVADRQHRIQSARRDPGRSSRCAVRARRADRRAFARNRSWPSNNMWPDSTRRFAAAGPARSARAWSCRSRSRRRRRARGRAAARDRRRRRRVRHDRARGRRCAPRGSQARVPSTDPTTRPRRRHIGTNQKRRPPGPPLRRSHVCRRPSRGGRWSPAPCPGSRRCPAP